MCRVTSLGGQGSGLLHAAYEGSAAWWGGSSYKPVVRPRQVSSPLQPAGPKAHQALPPRNKIGGAQIHLPWLVLPPVHWVTCFLAPQETQYNKLAKLGDAIAISKSETFTDPLTDKGWC